MSITDKIKEGIEEHLLSIPAQRLIEKLSLIKNRADNAKKRWFWELLQNASDYNDVVSVRLTVTPKEVVFSHNGQPFSIADALNLISPDSNKREDKVHLDNIGKFGTGFVSTHILSSVINVKGVCFEKDDNKYYEFSYTLDRSGYKCKENLIKVITEAQNEFTRSMTETENHEGYLTSFTYKLGHNLPEVGVVNASDIDLDYIYDVLPYTLCFMPKVKSVEIIDERIPSAVNTVSISRKATVGKDIIIEKCCNGSSKDYTFVYFENKDVSSVFLHKGNKIMAFPKGMSKMFCGLPLIGTEQNGIPFLINSNKFEPTPEREGVEIEPSVNDDNRNIMDQAVDLYKEILSYVAESEMHDAYILTCIKREYNGTQASRTQFYNRYISKYRDIILDSDIVINCKGDFIKLSETRLPFNSSKPDTALYDNASFVAESILPEKESYEKWFDVIDFSIFTSVKYTYTDLAKKIESQGNILGFGKSKEETTQWLKSTFAYLKACDRYIFSEKQILPNQIGEFKKSDELKSDIDLPSELKNIFNILFEGEDRKIESELLDRDFDFLEAVNTPYRVNNIAADIDDKLSKLYSLNKGMTEALKIPVNILYSWTKNGAYEQENLKKWFSWYYPKRATLIVDMLTDKEREQTLVISQSGKMEALAQLAVSDLTNEEINQLVLNIKRLPEALSLLMNMKDDTSNANEETGNIGEEIVYKDLLQKYPSRLGFRVIWASMDNNEPCYDFEITKNNKTLCYYDAKTTMRGSANADSIPFFMRKSQWTFLKTLDDDTPYYIARVFLGDNGKIKYLRISSGDENK